MVEADIPSAAWEKPLALGWHVIPLRQRAKTPAISGWQDHRANAATLARWAGHGANLGIVTGVASGLVVLDLDHAEAIASAKDRGLPRTVAARTAKGLHLYFRHPGGKVANRTGILPGMDIRADGGFVVAPGSIHPTGARYVWIIAPGDMALADMPAWLADLLARPAPVATVENPVWCAVTRDRPDGGQSTRYGLAALDKEGEAIRCAPCGQQERTLNASGFAIGTLIAGGELDRNTARADLVAAGVAMTNHDSQRPWAMAEIADKIDRALAAGTTHPRRAPVANQAKRKGS